MAKAIRYQKRGGGFYPNFLSAVWPDSQAIFNFVSKTTRRDLSRAKQTSQKTFLAGCPYFSARIWDFQLSGFSEISLLSS